MNSTEETPIFSMKEEARKVLEVFPSFNDLMNNHELYRTDKILLKSELKKFSKTDEWEGIALAADKVSSNMNGKEFWKDYGFDEQGNGSAEVVIDHMNTVMVDFDTFRALVLLFYISTIDIKISNEQRLAWRVFADDDTVKKILDQA